jgi:hypothetical protein
MPRGHFSLVTWTLEARGVIACSTFLLPTAQSALGLLALAQSKGRVVHVPASSPTYHSESIAAEVPLNVGCCI